MKTLALIAFATLCFASTEPIVSLASLKAVEASINDRVRSNIADPYDLLGPARGTYMEGYGAVFTFELNLILISPLNQSPFSPSISEKQIADMHDRKARKIEVLRAAMRDLMVNASRSLPGLPPEEHLVMEAYLFNYRWEQSRGLPHRIGLTTTKQKLLDAAAHHATDLTGLFEEWEL